MEIEDPRECEALKTTLKEAWQHKDRNGANILLKIDSRSMNVSSQLTGTILGFCTSELLPLNTSEYQTGKHSAPNEKSSTMFFNSTLSENVLHGSFHAYVTNMRLLHASVELEVHYPKGWGLHLTYSLHFWHKLYG